MTTRIGRSSNFRRPNDREPNPVGQINRQRSRLTVRIKHPTRDLARICKVMGLKPIRIWTRGDKRITPVGKEIGGVREYSYCAIELASSSRNSMQKQVATVITVLRPHKRMLRRISSTGGRISFFIGWFCARDTGERLDWEVLSAMAEMRISLDINIYIECTPTRRSTDKMR